MNQTTIIKKITPIVAEFKNLRVMRQKINNNSVLQAIQQDNPKNFKTSINEKEMVRTLDDLSVDFDTFWKKCKDDILFAKLASGRLAKKASRQGTKDECEQLRICNFTTQQCGVSIENLPATGVRPTKDGQIVSRKEMDDKNITMDCCLKSFDGKMSGKLNGFITAKVVFGNGGHQDNVFEEMDVMAEWWTNYKKESEEHLIVLIDTDLSDKFECIRKKYEEYNNIGVFNHVQFQKYIIDRFYEEST